MVGGRERRDVPVLWHLAMSHYNEKVRWALDWKRVPHVRRAVMPGVHQLVAKRLSGRWTLPILELEGRMYGESAEIIAALETYRPDPPLLPADPEQRKQALELEWEFDTVLAPAMRRAVYQEALLDLDFTARFMSVGGPPLRGRIFDLAMPAMAPAVRKTFRVPDRSDSGPRDVVRDQLRRIGELVADGGFLVGDSFTVADLAACSFLIPLVDISAMPTAMPELIPPLEPFSEEVSATPAGRWVGETYRRWRSGP